MQCQGAGSILSAASECYHGGEVPVKLQKIFRCLFLNFYVICGNYFTIFEATCNYFCVYLFIINFAHCYVYFVYYNVCVIGLVNLPCRYFLVMKMSSFKFNPPINWLSPNVLFLSGFIQRKQTNTICPCSVVTFVSKHFVVQSGGIWYRL